MNLEMALLALVQTLEAMSGLPYAARGHLQAARAALAEDPPAPAPKAAAKPKE